MRRIALVLASLLLISCIHTSSSIVPAGQPQKTVSQQTGDKAEVTKHKEGIAIRGGNSTYLYIYKEKQTVFMTLSIFNGKKAVAVAALDKEDRPLQILFLMLSEDGKEVTERIAVPKTEKTKQLYEKMEQFVAQFIAKYEVKKILRENGINK